jgi:hypothetical protein
MVPLSLAVEVASNPLILFNFDLSALLNLNTELRPACEAALREGGEDLSKQAHGHIAEEAQEKLHSSREKFQNALSFEQVDANTFILSLDASALFIEEGLPAGFDMLPGLLGSKKAKFAKDGSRFIIVPFAHQKGPTQQTPAQKSLTDTIKSEMKKLKIPYKKVETDSQGRPKIGKLHSFDINAPMKTHEGVGQGHGPVGAPKQGPTGIPFLHRVSVYQRQVQDKMTKKMTTQRGIFTFRIASSKHVGQNRWKHPGIEGKHFFEECETWALDLWTREIAPKIINKVVDSL